MGIKSRVRVHPMTLAHANRWLRYEHYLHRDRRQAQLAYGIFLDNLVVGAMLFALPWGSKVVCGYPSMKVLELARMWLGDHTPHLASCAIGKALKQVKADWTSKYPHLEEPVAVVSWADPEFGHEGIIYLAAGFRLDGDSSGHKQSKRGRDSEDYEHIKHRYIKELN